MSQMVSPKLLKTTLNKYHMGQGDYIPYPGEIIVICLDDIDKQMVKIGDGLNSIQNLPEVNMRVDYEFSAPWINRVIEHIPEEVWKRAEKNIKKRQSSWHATEVIVESVRILSEEYYNL